MDRTTELYRGYTLQSSALQHRDTPDKWSGSFVIIKDGAEVKRASVAGPLDSEEEASENALRMARNEVDHLAGD